MDSSAAFPQLPGARDGVLVQDLVPLSPSLVRGQ